MEWVAIVIGIALIQYVVFGILVGRARAKYNCPAPAMSGDPVFERYYRVQANTGEQLLILLPAMVIYGYYGNPLISALAGAVFILGRVIYLRGYVSDPSKRGLGFMVSFLPIAFLIVAGIISAALNLAG
jgi:glutathione S-transferase